MFCIEEMRPNQIVEIVLGSSMVFIPVSPRYEWHSYQLAVGCDGIISEEVSKLLAGHFQAAWFRCLSFGLDQWRSAEFKAQNGLPEDQEIFGMNFPDLPFESEYSDIETMKSAVVSRLDAVKGTGFRYAFIVNHHGGEGQDQTLKDIAAETAADDFKVEFIRPSAFNTFKPDKEYDMHLKVGGHAGLAETVQLMAFRPDLVDLNEIPEGPLNAAEFGILHREPVIPEEYNPRNALQFIADEYRKNIINNLTAYIKKKL